MIGGRTLMNLSDEIIIIDLIRKEYMVGQFLHKICAMSSLQVGDDIYLYGGTDG